MVAVPSLSSISSQCCFAASLFSYLRCRWDNTWEVAVWPRLPKSAQSWKVIQNTYLKKVSKIRTYSNQNVCMCCICLGNCCFWTGNIVHGNHQNLQWLPWTMSDMVKYKGSEINKDQRAALYFTMSDIVPKQQLPTVWPESIWKKVNANLGICIQYSLTHVLHIINT